MLEQIYIYITEKDSVLSDTQSRKRIRADMSESKRPLIYYKILQYQDENLELLEKHFDIIYLNDPDEDTPEILREADVILAPLGFFLGKEKIDLSPNLKIIASNTTGVPHIDVSHAKSKGIKVLSLQDQTGFLDKITPSAELTFGLIISLTRRIPWSFDAVKSGVWNRRLFGGKSMLSRMNLGVVGLGRLGKMVARYGKSFGMKVYYYEQDEKTITANDLIKLNSLEELVASSDIVTVHINLTEENRGLFNKRIFSQFKDGSYFINTSRGEVIDFSALLDCLKSGKLAGAALDVFEEEFNKGFQDYLKNHPLLDYAKTHDNLIITPHIGGSTYDAWKETEEHTIRLILENL